MKIRIQFSYPTVKALEAQLQKMVKYKDAKLVRRISALLEHIHQQVPVAEVAQKWGVSQAAVYHWLQLLCLKGWKVFVTITKEVAIPN